MDLQALSTQTAISHDNPAPATSCPPDALHAAAQRCLRVVRACWEPDVILPIANLTLTMSNMKGRERLSQRGRSPRSSRASQSPGLTQTTLCAVPLCQGRERLVSLPVSRMTYPLRESSTQPSIISPGNQTPLSRCLYGEESEARLPLRDQTRPRSSIARVLAQQQVAVCVTLVCAPSLASLSISVFFFLSFHPLLPYFSCVVNLQVWGS